jgi:hypothetical protein
MGRFFQVRQQRAEHRLNLMHKSSRFCRMGLSPLPTSPRWGEEPDFPPSGGD